MRQAILKITTVTLLAAGIVGTSALTWADDAATPTTNPSTPTTKPEQTGVTKFYGSVVSVDTTAMTFTVGDQTFSVTGETQMTKDGKTATLADAVVGEPARGSYTPASDGKLTVTKVRFGKKTGGKGGGKKKSAATTQPEN
jgi:hypothetical protein